MDSSHRTASTLQKCKIIYAPYPFAKQGRSVFLAGSIEMGKAVDWQTSICASLSHLPITILNPRRPDWDSTWQQDISCKPFREQVEWELEMQEDADIIAIYFDPATLAPISLLELGLFARTGKMIVACPTGYWRKGNIQIVCKRLGIQLVDSLEELSEKVSHRFAELGASWSGNDSIFTVHCNGMSWLKYSVLIILSLGSHKKPNIGYLKNLP